MPAGLETCPPEVLESIIALLDLEAVCNLRLGCRSVAVSSAQISWRRFFSSKHVDLTSRDLLAFSRVTRHGGVSCQVQHLHLAGVVREVERTEGSSEMLTTSACDSHTSDKLALLDEAFDNLTKYGKDGTLSSLSLRVAFIRSNGQRDVPLRLNRGWLPHKSMWQCTVDTFRAAIQALASSELRVERLNVFNGPDLQMCSLACDQLNVIDWGDPGIVNLFAALTSLSISLCDRNFTFREDEHEQDSNHLNLTPSSSSTTARGAYDRIEDESRQRFPRSNTAILAACRDEDNFAGLANLVGACPRLRHLELHYSHVAWSLEDSMTKSFRRERLFEQVVRLGRLPHLESCAIRGLTMREEDLLEFLRRTRPTELSVEYSHLCTGTFQPVLDYCTSSSAGISKLYLNAIHKTNIEGEYQGLTVFNEKGESIKYDCIMDDGTELLNRQGSKSVQKPITCYIQPPFTEGEPSVVTWIRFQRLEYGL
ncbi:F-box domain protein [Mariannaea sp. PMI_226]|nr:F-box domain protein [Mariannaea sp. PMI_226]